MLRAFQRRSCATGNFTNGVADIEEEKGGNDDSEDDDEDELIDVDGNDDDDDENIQSECMTGCDGNMAADVADGATHPSSPTIRKKYVAIMMMIIVVINMRVMIMVRMKIMLGWRMFLTI